MRFGLERPRARAAYNYANTLVKLERFEEAKSLTRKTIPVVRRVLGEGNEHTLKMRSLYAYSLYSNPGATLEDLREAVTTLEETEMIARRVFGGAHPTTAGIEDQLRYCLLYTSPSPRDATLSRMPSSA